MTRPGHTWPVLHADLEEMGLIRINMTGESLTRYGEAKLRDAERNGWNDPPSEWILAQDDDTGTWFEVAPAACGMGCRCAAAARRVKEAVLA